MTDVATPPAEHEHRLPDGRALFWCEYGDPDGAPLLYFHGIPGSRLDGRVTAEQMRAAGLRSIVVERPGFGRSDQASGKRTYAGWARDVEHLVEALGIDRFALLGYSAGGPYALAVAETLPGRVTRVGLVSTVAPSEMPGYRDAVCPTDKAMTILARRAPWLARMLLARAIGVARKDEAKFQKEVDKDFSAPPDQEILNSGLRPTVTQLFLEANRDGPAGMVEDFAVWARPSGIALDRIEAPVRLWHGEEDRTIPIAHSRWLASMLPGAELTPLPGIGHLHTPERWQDFATALA